MLRIQTAVLLWPQQATPLPVLDTQRQAVLTVFTSLKVMELLRLALLQMQPHAQVLISIATQALAHDVPLLMNKHISGGWKYINELTGEFFTDMSDFRQQLEKILRNARTKGQCVLSCHLYAETIIIHVLCPPKAARGVV